VKRDALFSAYKPNFVPKASATLVGITLDDSHLSGSRLAPRTLALYDEVAPGRCFSPRVVASARCELLPHLFSPLRINFFGFRPKLMMSRYSFCDTIRILRFLVGESWLLAIASPPSLFELRKDKFFQNLGLALRSFSEAGVFGLSSPQLDISIYRVQSDYPTKNLLIIANPCKKSRAASDVLPASKI